MRRRSTLRRNSRHSRSSNASGGLNSDSNVIDEKDPLWWNALENNTRLSARFNLSERASSYLNSGSELETSSLPDKWWERLDISKRFSENNVPSKNTNNRLITQTDREANEGNSLEISEKDSIKRRKPALTVPTRNYESDSFSRVLNDSFGVESELASNTNRKSRASLVSFSSDDKLLKHKRQLRRSTRRVQRSTGINVYDEVLTGESTTVHDSVEKSIASNSEVSVNSEKGAIEKSRPDFLIRRNWKNTPSRRSLVDEFVSRSDCEAEHVSNESNLPEHLINQQSNKEDKDNSNDNENRISNSNLSLLRTRSKRSFIDAPELAFSNEIDNPSYEIQSEQHERIIEENTPLTSNLSENVNTDGIDGNIPSNSQILKKRVNLQQKAKRKSLTNNTFADVERTSRRSIYEILSKDASSLQESRENISLKAKTTSNKVGSDSKTSPILNTSLRDVTLSKRLSKNKTFVDDNIISQNNNILEDDRDISEAEIRENPRASIFTSNSTVDTPLKHSKILVQDKSRYNVPQTSNDRLETQLDTKNVSKDISEITTAFNKSHQLTKNNAKDLFSKEKQAVSSRIKITQNVPIVDRKKIDAMTVELKNANRQKLITLKDGKLDKYFKSREIPLAVQKLLDRNAELLKSKKRQLSRKQLKNIDQPFTKQTKNIDKAYIVNGVVYKRPRLPRPASWVTDRLYHYLWKCMKPKYKERTRVCSEKFVVELSKIVALTIRRKKYENYKNEVKLLMKEMAHMGIIKTRNDFYHFCQEFLPYSFRIKVVPTYVPGSGINIPYNPESLHTPIICD